MELRNRSLSPLSPRYYLSFHSPVHWSNFSLDIALRWNKSSRRKAIWKINACRREMHVRQRCVWKIGRDFRKDDGTVEIYSRRNALRTGYPDIHKNVTGERYVSFVKRINAKLTLLRRQLCRHGSSLSFRLVLISRGISQAISRVCRSTLGSFFRGISRNKILPAMHHWSCHLLEIASIRKQKHVLVSAREYPLGDQQVLMAATVAPMSLLFFRSLVISGVTRRNLTDLWTAMRCENVPSKNRYEAERDAAEREMLPKDFFFSHDGEFSDFCWKSPSYARFGAEGKKKTTIEKIPRVHVSVFKIKLSRRLTAFSSW